MLKAKELIISSDDTIANIAGQVGFSKASYVSKVFKQEFGIHRNNYEKRNRVN